MEKLTGVVMEKEGNSIVVLTESGEFRRVKVAGRIPDIGEEIRIPARPTRKWSVPRLGFIAAAAAVLLLMLVSPLAYQFTQPPETAVAWVSVDINPAIELVVSNREKVMAAQALNPEGEKVLTLLDVKGMKVRKAVNEITGKALELGYIGKSGDNTVLIGIAVKPGAGINKFELQNTLLASANEVLQGDTLKGTVQVVSVPTELRENAIEKKITAGKYAVLIEAVTKYNLNLTEEDMKKKSVVKAIADAGGKADEVLAKARQEKDFDKNEKEYLQIASERQTAVAAVGIDGRSGNDGAGSKGGGDEGNGSKKPSSNEHRYVEGINRDGNKDPETVIDGTYKNGQDNNGNNSSGGSQTDGTQEPPAQPEQPTDPQPDSGRGGLQENTGNYVIAAPPVDDQGMYRRKPNF